MLSQIFNDWRREFRGAGVGLIEYTIGMSSELKEDDKVPVAFLKKYGCASPTVRKFEQGLAKIPLN